MLTIFLAIALNSISLISCDCGIPGVPAFARIVNFDPKMTKYPDGYEIKYDCTIPNGLNINGEEKRVCTGQDWIPWDIPICDIPDPDDGRSEFQIEVLDINNMTKKSSFLNNWSLYGSQDSYVDNLRNNFIYYASSQTSLWKIKFAKQYPVETDHSFLVIMVFVIPHNSTLDNSNINIEIESKFTSTKRTCHVKKEIDSIKKLLESINSTSLIANSSWQNDTFHKIIMECRNDWIDRPFRWQGTSKLEQLTGLNFSLKTDSFAPIELILTQLTVDVDCGYPDIPTNANYTRSWMNTAYSCDVGKFIGERNLSCHHSGRWSKPKTLPKCCVGNECDIMISGSDNTITVIIASLSSAVVVLGLLVIALFIRSRRKHKTRTIERSKSISNDYDDIDLNGDQTYDHIKQPDYEEINYDQINCYQLEMYDDCHDARERRMSMRVMMKEMKGEYVQMEKYDHYLAMASKPNSNASICENQNSNIYQT